MSPASSSRWCPTPEQLMILEEMYRAGVRTPNAEQIQQITAHLSFYGKIEGKNVFYWFQNHKARDRQKLKRKLSKQLIHQPLLHHHHHHHHHHHLLSYLDPHPSPPATPLTHFQQFPHHHKSVGLHSQVQDASKQAASYMWQTDDCEMDKSLGRTQGPDLMTTLNVDPPAATSRCNKPLKTLQLFPVTATGFKDHQPSVSYQTP